LFSCKKDGEILYKKRFFYDFVIPKIKVIIEYNGEKFHPNPNVLNEKEWEIWKTPFGVNADNQFLYQKEKLDLAISAHYNILEIWSSTTKEVNLNLCKEFIIQNENTM